MIYWGQREEKSVLPHSQLPRGGTEGGQIWVSIQICRDYVQKQCPIISAYLEGFTVFSEADNLSSTCYLIFIIFQTNILYILKSRQPMIVPQPIPGNWVHPSPTYETTLDQYGILALKDICHLTDPFYHLWNALFIPL